MRKEIKHAPSYQRAKAFGLLRFIRPQRSRHWISRAWCRRLRRYRAGDGPQRRPPSGRRSGSDNADGADGRAPTFSGAAVRRMVRARPSHRNVTSTPTLKPQSLRLGLLPFIASDEHSGFQAFVLCYGDLEQRKSMPGKTAIRCRQWPNRSSLISIGFLRSPRPT